MANYDIIGNVAIVKFPEGVKTTEKKKEGQRILEEHKAVRTVLEKSNNFSGRLRTIKTNFICGEDTREALYKENSCVFRLNVETCYFSPRLSTEREELTKKVKKGEKVLVMFAGVGPFSIVIGKNSKAKNVVSVELGRECNKYAKENVKRNKLENVEVVGGDVRRVIGPEKKVSEKFDRIVMARPNLKDSFLDVAFSVCKKGTEIHYYGFYHLDEVEERDNKLKNLILGEAKKAGKKVKITHISRAGDIAPYKFRYRCDFKIL